MADSNIKRRKDPTGRVLREGEGWREKDARYIYRWRPYRGAKQQAIYASTLDELRKKEAEIKKNLYNGVNYNNITLNEMFTRLMETKGENALRVTTSTTYLYMWDKYVKPSRIGYMKIADIKYSDLKKFYTDLLDIHNLKISTLDNIHTLIHPTFTLAVRDKLLPANPSDGLLSIIKKERKLETTKKEGLSQEEQTTFLNFVANSSTYKHWLPLFIVGFGTGTRASELLSLTWDDVDFPNNRISINHQLIYHSLPNGTCDYVLSSPKTQKGIRFVHMFPEVREALLQVKKEQEVIKPIQPVIEGYTNFVFLNREKYIHNRATVNKAIQRIVRDYNLIETANAAKENREPFLLKPFSCHIMRHSMATRLYEANADPLFTKTMMGHSDIATTLNIYTSLSEQKEKELAKDLDQKVKIRSTPTTSTTSTPKETKGSNEG